MIAAFLPLLHAPCAMSSVSTLVGSRWRLKLDIGLEPGSYLARTDWGSSGGRLRFDAVVDFEEAPASEAEELVGPLSGTRVLRPQRGGTFVGFEGEKEVAFTSGGWCVQRRIGASTATEGLLRFWLDCSSGAQKGDVTVEAGERLFFSTGVWDDAEELKRLVRHRDAMEAKLKGGGGGDEDGGPLERIPGLAKLNAFRKQLNAYDEKVALTSQKQFYAQLPNLGDGPAAIANARGGLSVKRPSGGGAFSSQYSYHILGSFEAEAVSSDVSVEKGA